MIDWMARAQAEILGLQHAPTVKTDEIPLSSVLTVQPGAVFELHDPLSTVSSVGVGATFENRLIAAALMDAAMKVCDRYGDHEAARQEMRQDCLDLPPHLQADLLAHFSGNRSP